MATRGCVGVKTGNLEWRGIYNHWDSYPTGLGKDVWDYLHSDGVDLDQFCKEILEYTDWREFLNKGVCPYCGKKGVGQPCNISGRIYGWDKNGRELFEKTIEQCEDKEIRENLIKTGYPDPEAKYHSHHNKKAGILSKNAKYDALFIEWAYIIDPALRQLEIYKGVRAKGYHYVEGIRGKFKENNYQYVIVAVIDLDGDEPDWEAIEKRGYELSDRAWKYYGDGVLKGLIKEEE